VAKILVADDNSNVQKTVALALADLGVEIISVNNGEAAVRKLPDVSPDLVLADIFMPVRNGYEVCEYVKKDSRFSRVPVVLLVGAFDPLDEREAQRVGADGILKKPFVPTDPLITMVKTLLDRTLGDRLVAVSASRSAVPVQARAGGSATSEVRSAAPEISEETSSQEFPAPASRVAFGDGERPIAFGQLLESTVLEAVAAKPEVIEPIDDEQVLTGSRHETLGEPIFWRNDTHEPEAEAADPEEAASVPEERTWKKDEDTLPLREEVNLLQPIEPVELVREEQDQTSPSVVDSQSLLLDAAAQARLTVEPGKPDDLAANPLEWMAATLPKQPAISAEPPTEKEEAIPEAVETIDEEESVEIPFDLGLDAVSDSGQPSASVLVPVSSEPDTVKADQIASSSTPAMTVVPPVPQPVPSSPKPAGGPWSALASVMDTARSLPKRDWADLAGPVDSPPSQLDAHQNKPVSTPAVQPPVAAAGNTQPATPSPARNDSPDPALVEAVVQRVLDKMRPQVVDIITKEFLRPIVQALVHREIEKQ
jgi:CheY-like chemotaxis protein